MVVYREGPLRQIQSERRIHRRAFLTFAFLWAEKFFFPFFFILLSTAVVPKLFFLQGALFCRQIYFQCSTILISRHYPPLYQWSQPQDTSCDLPLSLFIVSHVCFRFIICSALTSSGSSGHCSCKEGCEERSYNKGNVCMDRRLWMETITGLSFKRSLFVSIVKDNFLSPLLQFCESCSLYQHQTRQIFTHYKQ